MQGKQSAAAKRRAAAAAKGGNMAQNKPMSAAKAAAQQKATAARWDGHLPAKHKPAAQIQGDFTNYAFVRKVLNSQAAIVEAAQAELVTGAPLAARFLLNVIRGDIEGSTVTNRIEAAKIVLTANGALGGAAVGQQSSTAKDINGLPLSELRAFIEAGSARLAELKAQQSAQTVDGETVS